MLSAGTELIFLVIFLVTGAVLWFVFSFRRTDNTLML